MTSRDFAFWLQGFFEITGTNKIDEGQAEMIKSHLNLVFKHEIDPSLNKGKSKEEVQDLQDIHDGKPLPEKDQAAVNYLNGVFTTKPNNLHGGWINGSSDDTLLRC